MNEEVITLQELTQRISRLISVAETRDVWVSGEILDLRRSGGHCYFELVEKDNNGRAVAKVKCTIWASIYGRLNTVFHQATGQQLATGMKVMLRVTACFTPLYGMSVNVTGINPEFTLGDLLRRRNEILRRLHDEGILNLNRELHWPDIPTRIAVVSSPTAAGYGDFLKHLYSNPSHIRFSTTLFECRVQGETAAESIIGALERIAADYDSFDGVAIIRGGGATHDLNCFESYDLAAAIAQFPLPVIIGIGHERDVTLLDYVANVREKTPTAVAEWFVRRADSLLTRLTTLAQAILQQATDIMASEREHLCFIDGQLPILPHSVTQRASQRLLDATNRLSAICNRRITPPLERLRMIADSLPTISATALRHANDRLTNSERLVEALSPQSVLARGYSITRHNGVAVTDSSAVKPGDTVTTIFANGSIQSTITSSNK